LFLITTRPEEDPHVNAAKVDPCHIGAGKKKKETNALPPRICKEVGEYAIAKAESGESEPQKKKNHSITGRVSNKSFVSSIGGGKEAPKRR